MLNIITYIIYLVTNKENGHKYVGKTCQGLSERKRKHYLDARHRDTIFCRALRKYSEDTFKWEILVEVSEDEVDDMERYYISKYNTYLDPDHYNMTEGGEGYRLSEEIKKKISIANTGKVRTKEMRAHLSKVKTGVPLSENHRLAVIKGLIGRKHSENTKQKMSRSAKDRWTEEERKRASERSMGRQVSQDTRNKMSASKIETLILMATNQAHTLVFFSRLEAYEYFCNMKNIQAQYKTFTSSIRNGIKNNQNRYGYKWSMQKL